jgi:hypothetical protein
MSLINRGLNPLKTARSDKELSYSSLRFGDAFISDLTVTEVANL